MTDPRPPWWGHRLAAGTVLAGVVLTGCAPSRSGPADASAATAGSSAAGTAHPGPGGLSAQASLPSAHVHGVGLNPGDDRVYLATHDGLFRYDEAGPTRVGPVIDLMGFTVAGPDHFYASGHPGPGVDLPEPLGLMESTDAGRTWQPLSRQGESDFHALAASSGGVVGFDGAALLTSSDGSSWRQLDPPVAPYALAVSPVGDTFIATSQEGPVRSADGGATWSRLTQAPLLQVVDWASEQTAVGITPDGTVEVSHDSGATWTPTGTVDGAPMAVGATSDPDGSLRVLAVTEHGVLTSTDSAATFTTLNP